MRLEESDDSLKTKEWEVEKITNERKCKKGRKSTVEYLVKWVGFKHPTWEPKENLENCQEALNDYLKEKAGKMTKKAEEQIPLSEDKFESKMKEILKRELKREIENKINEENLKGNKSIEITADEVASSSNEIIISENKEKAPKKYEKAVYPKLAEETEYTDEVEFKNKKRKNKNRDRNQDKDKESFSINNTAKVNRNNGRNHYKRNKRNKESKIFNPSEISISESNHSNEIENSQPISLEDIGDIEDLEKEKEIKNGKENGKEEINKIEVIEIFQIKIPEKKEENFKANIKYKIDGKIDIQEFDTNDSRIPPDALVSFYESVLRETSKGQKLIINNYFK